MSVVTLVIVEGPDVGREIPIEGTVLVGRDPGADVVLADSEISSRHASFAQLGDGVSVEDVGSTNGTFVNGQRVTSTHVLSSGDRVQLGATTVEVRGGPVAPPAEPPPVQKTRAKAIPTLPLLVFTSGQLAGTEQAVGEQVVLGRDPGAADIVLDEDADVSRRHAAFSPAGAGLIAWDLGSTNGTIVNGHRLDQAVTLSSGDRVEVGNTAIEVRVPAEEAVAPPAAAPAAAAAAPGPANDIVVENLVKDYGSHRAVQGINLYVNPGEVYGFLGPNGAGKSTTVEMLTTLIPPTHGTARISGHDIVTHGAEVRTVTGVALQAAALDNHLNAWEHMDLQAALQGIPKSERRQRGAELLERVALTDAADRVVGGYSGGMKRRLDLALALVHRPRVLFLDEPTTGLDPQSRTALWQEVARLVKEDGVTVFLTTQYLEEADVLADRIGIIDHGDIVAEGTPEALKEEIGRPTVEVDPLDDADWTAVSAVLERFGELTSTATRGVGVRLAPGVNDVADVIRALDAEGLRFTNVQFHAPTLDDVFLAKTGHSLGGAGEEPQAQEPGALEQFNASGTPGAPSPAAVQ